MITTSILIAMAIASVLLLIGKVTGIVESVQQKFPITYGKTKEDK